MRYAARVLKRWKPGPIEGGRRNARLRSLDEISYHRRPGRLSRGLRYTLAQLRALLLLGLFLGIAYVFRPGAPAWIESGPIRVDDMWRVRVIDGDTFHYNGETVRIAGIDAPEINPPRCPREAELGAKATSRLDRLLRTGPFDMHPVRRDEDKYGRKLRTVMRDGQSIGAILISEGLARRLDGARQPWC